MVMRISIGGFCFQDLCSIVGIIDSYCILVVVEFWGRRVLRRGYSRRVQICRSFQFLVRRQSDIRGIMQVGYIQRNFMKWREVIQGGVVEFQEGVMVRGFQGRWVLSQDRFQGCRGLGWGQRKIYFFNCSFFWVRIRFVFLFGFCLKRQENCGRGQSRIDEGGWFCFFSMCFLVLRDY